MNIRRGRALAGVGTGVLVLGVAGSIFGVGTASALDFNPPGPYCSSSVGCVNGKPLPSSIGPTDPTALRNRLSCAGGVALAALAPEVTIAGLSGAALTLIGC